MDKLDCGARYIRFTPLKALGNFFSASEIKVYKKENRGVCCRSTNKAEAVTDADYTNMKNYLGVCVEEMTHHS